MWRTLSLVIIGFWLVMSSLLVRYVWFPEGTQFSEVPVRMVLKQFLEQASASKSTASNLDLYRQGEKIGDARISCGRSRHSPNDFSVHMGGSLDKGSVPSLEGVLRWDLTLKLGDVDRFNELNGNLRVENTRKIIRFNWKRGQQMPSISLHGDDADAGDALIQSVMAPLVAGAGLSAMAGSLGASGDSEIASMIQMRARETVMDFAGQQSKGYLVEFTAMDRWKARAFVTEAGELALINLPEGYRLIEPVIHGVARDYDAEDEAEAAAEAAAAAAAAAGEKQKEP